MLVQKPGSKTHMSSPMPQPKPQPKLSSPKMTSTEEPKMSSLKEPDYQPLKPLSSLILSSLSSPLPKPKLKLMRKPPKMPKQMLMMCLLLLLVIAPSNAEMTTTMYRVLSAPFLFKSQGVITEPGAVLRSMTRDSECDCLGKCLVREDCLSFSFNDLSGNCSLHAVRGSGTRTQHDPNTVYRVRDGMAHLGDWCRADSECQFTTGGVATCVRGTCSCPAGLAPVSWTECGVPPTTTTVTVPTTTGPTTSEATTTNATATPTTTTEVPTTTNTTTEATTTITTNETTTTTVSTTPVSTTTEDPCGLQGTILSPNYPSNYEHSSDVFWTIVAEPGQTISVDIVDFALEAENDDGDCDDDYVQFRDGDSMNAPSLQSKICGTTYPPTVGPTTSNVLTIALHTDSYRRDRGFNITWKICGAGAVLGACDAAMSYLGTIQSINYPNDYEFNRKTTWHLVATHPDRNFRLEFQDFDLETSGSCNYDWVDITETVSGASAGPYCGATIPPPYGPSADPGLMVYFRSDYNNPGRGFSAHWTAVCPATTA